MLIKTALTQAAARLKEAGISCNLMEARLLLSESFGMPLEYILAHIDDSIDEDEIIKFNSLVERRTKLEPIAYIIGRKEFFGRDFFVNHNTLIPRPDSEILVEAVIADVANSDVKNILELGCGSGCLIITIAAELESKNIAYTALDISEEALSVAKSNAQNLHRKIDFLKSNWFDDLPQNSVYDIIISNPPYISRSSLAVAKETLLYEPDIALFSNDDGLESYKIIARESGKFLSDSGKIYLEIGYDQADAVTEIFTKNSFTPSSSYKDLSGYIRCLSFERAR